MTRGADLLDSPLRWLGLPGWLLYRPLVALHGLCRDRGLLPVHRLPAPVVSVGNLSAGGTGKTPLVAWLRDELTRRGRRPAVLARGYKAAPGTSLNDEAAMLGGLVVCDRDRARGGRQALANRRGRYEPSLAA